MPEDCLQVRTKGTWRRRLLFSGGNILAFEQEEDCCYFRRMADVFVLEKERNLPKNKKKKALDGYCILCRLFFRRLDVLWQGLVPMPFPVNQNRLCLRECWKQNFYRVGQLRAWISCAASGFHHIGKILIFSFARFYLKRNC